MEQSEVMERVVKILTPWVKNEEALKSVSAETNILDDLKVNSARLVDVDTGVVIWSGSKTVVKSSSDGQSSLVGMMVGAVVNQVTTSVVSDPTRGVSRQANGQLYCAERYGLLYGEYSPQYVDPSTLAASE